MSREYSLLAFSLREDVYVFTFSRVSSEAKLTSTLRAENSMPEAEAKAAFQNVVDEGDWGAAGNVIKIAGSGASQSFDHVVKEYQERFIAGWGGYPIVGTPEQVTEELVKLNEAGMDGMIMGLIDYKEELEIFNDDILPLMKQAGIRH